MQNRYKKSAAQYLETQSITVSFHCSKYTLSESIFSYGRLINVALASF